MSKSFTDALHQSQPRIIKLSKRIETDPRYANMKKEEAIEIVLGGLLRVGCDVCEAKGYNYLEAPHATVICPTCSGRGWTFTDEEVHALRLTGNNRYSIINTYVPDHAVSKVLVIPFEECDVHLERYMSHSVVHIKLVLHDERRGY